MICLAVCAALVVAVQSTTSCGANQTICTEMSNGDPSKIYECISGECWERTCTNDAMCDNVWYGPNYHCNMDNDDYTCEQDQCVNHNDTQCDNKNPGYICSYASVCQKKCNAGGFCLTHEGEVCDSSGHCSRHECVSDAECETKWFSSDWVCKNTTERNWLEQICEFNVDFGNCKTDNECKVQIASFMDPPSETIPFPLAFCNQTSGGCEVSCHETGCDGYSEYIFNSTGGKELGYQPVCGEDDSCGEVETCQNDTDCEKPFTCFGQDGDDEDGYCVLHCNTTADCNQRYFFQNSNGGGGGVECHPFGDNKYCITLNTCSSDMDCLENDDNPQNLRCVDQYCRKISCENDDATCQARFDNNFAKCYDGFCLDNQCLNDDDCLAPFDACYANMEAASSTGGNICYKKCDADDQCTEFGKDDYGIDILCEKGAPGDPNLEYCDVFTGNYTSCILSDYQCSTGFTCDRQSGECKQQTTAAPLTAPSNAPTADEDSVKRYNILTAAAVVFVMVGWITLM